MRHKEKYDGKFLAGLYRSMLRIRLAEEALVAPIIDREVRCPVHLCSGQEAVAAGVCAALEIKDYVFGTHRSHGHFLAKDGNMRELMAEIYCRQTGCCRGRGGSMHLIDPEVGMLGAAPIVGGTISLAVGAALASSIRGDGRVTVSFFGDGATGEGVLYESLNFAALKKLPVIFACENNLYSTHMSINECRPGNNIFQTALPFCVESLRVDGNDVLAVYEAAKKSVDKCRKGQGPVFMEFMTYRLRGHVGPDDNIQGTHTDIRPPEEIEAWKKKDPIKGFKRYLLGKGVVKEEELNKIDRGAKKEVDDALEFARKSPRPAKGELAKYVYSK